MTEQTTCALCDRGALHNTCVIEIDATEPGALSGYQVTCDRCGLEIRSSLRTALEFDLQAHDRWHAGTDRGLLAPVPGPAGSTR